MNITPISRRSTLAALAGAAALPLATAPSGAAPGHSSAPDWKAIHAELLASYAAWQAASDVHDRTHEEIIPRLPECVADVPRIIFRGCSLGWTEFRPTCLRNVQSINDYFDKAFQLARKVGARSYMSGEKLAQFIDEGKALRREAIAHIQRQKAEWDAIWKAEMGEVLAARDAAQARADAIEDLVRDLPADTLEAVHLKLILGRRYTDDFEFDQELLDGMLRDLGAVTCLRGNEVT